MRVVVELQYSDGCPNHITMRDNLVEALRGLEDEVHLIETAVGDEKTASKVQFRGSPTLLIDGEDMEGMPPPGQASLSCRVYPDGVPTMESIRTRIKRACTQG